MLYLWLPYFSRHLLLDEYVLDGVTDDFEPNMLMLLAVNVLQFTKYSLQFTTYKLLWLKVVLIFRPNYYSYISETEFYWACLPLIA